MQQMIRSLKQWLKRMSMGAAKMQPMSPRAVQKFAQQLEQTQDTEYDCDDVLRLLDQFSEAVLHGKDVAQLMPLVQRHLEMCADCREEFDALMRILRASPA